MDTSLEIDKWIDPAIKSLQGESSTLSEQIDVLEKEHAELERVIHFFEVRHNRELGDLVLRILNVRKTIAAKKIARQPGNIDVKEEYEQAAKDECDFKNNYDYTIKTPIPELDSNQLDELKKKRNRIARLLHDNTMITEQYKKEANELMVKTNEAYKKNDIRTITEIFDYVENGKPFKIDYKTSTEAGVLAAEIKYKQSVVKRLGQEINSFKGSDTYQTISQISDWDEYFRIARAQFNVELENLERQIQ